MPFFVIKKGLVLLEWKYFPTPKILDPILAWLISIVLFNALFEMIVGFILVSIIGSVLLPIAERANIIG
ncbi:hypothetical protein EFN38_01870 [Leuconostoc mesenteroides]|nr:hypothetical protein LMT8_05785 [Leuconostoc mesenteroides subsp. cremoris TIFN8]KDA51847.1 Substrate-specific component PanT of predicted pantothenate ECF transporter [Leuconostoc mesenteroides subsp. cremoris T26]MCT3043783.1 hypothetical protein [Leuconostoc mesenteroides]ORI38231.1 hypothetical protein BMR90_04345 [Leuconostoc mesenteroides subsp. cremoris]ORI38837.1 hypothetical protein BMR89_04105 [Leuconostoc mesenteroides subsp. cremoris]